jgi:hypothetical protein
MGLRANWDRRTVWEGSQRLIGLQHRPRNVIRIPLLVGYKILVSFNGKTDFTDNL